MCLRAWTAQHILTAGAVLLEFMGALSALPTKCIFSGLHHRCRSVPSKCTWSAVVHPASAGSLPTGHRTSSPLSNRHWGGSKRVGVLLQVAPQVTFGFC